MSLNNTFFNSELIDNSQFLFLILTYFAIKDNASARWKIKNFWKFKSQKSIIDLLFVLYDWCSCLRSIFESLVIRQNVKRDQSAVKCICMHVINDKVFGVKTCGIPLSKSVPNFKLTGSLERKLLAGMSKKCSKNIENVVSRHFEKIFMYFFLRKKPSSCFKEYSSNWINEIGSTVLEFCAYQRIHQLNSAVYLNQEV